MWYFCHTINFIYPLQNECFHGYPGISLSVCPCVYVSICVQNTSFCQSTGKVIKSQLVTSLICLRDRILSTTIDGLSLCQTVSFKVMDIRTGGCRFDPGSASFFSRTDDRDWIYFCIINDPLYQ